MTLDDLHIGQVARVTGASDGSAAAELRSRLEDIGFDSGEWVEVLTRAALGGDPMVIRVGHSRFVLRRNEARCVQVMIIDRERRQ
jgi:ferrous iron transport protein A